jgi:hypothetical protein
MLLMGANYIIDGQNRKLMKNACMRSTKIVIKNI